MGRKPKLNRINVKQAIKNCYGNYSTIAQRLNVERSSITRFFQKYPDLRKLADEDRQKVCDLSESQVTLAIKNGDMQTTRWFLDAHGKDRGYGKIDNQYNFIKQDNKLSQINVQIPEGTEELLNELFTNKETSISVSNSNTEE